MAEQNTYFIDRIICEDVALAAAFTNKYVPMTIKAGDTIRSDSGEYALVIGVTWECSNNPVGFVCLSIKRP